MSVATVPSSTTSPTPPSVTAPPVIAAPTGVMAAASIGHYLAGRKGNITAAMYDVDDGTLSLWRPGVTEYTASIEKVAILATLLHQNQDQGRSLSASDAAVASKMIERSDNSSADTLWNEVGRADGVAAFDRLLGLSSTIPGTEMLWGYTQTTAADQITLMKAIVLPGPLLDAASRAYMLGLMEHVVADEAWGVSAGVTRGATIALKNGWLPLESDNWQVNSIGWVDSGERNYILAVLTNENPTEAYGIQTIEGLSELIWTSSAA